MYNIKIEPRHRNLEDMVPKGAVMVVDRTLEVNALPRGRINDCESLATVSFLRLIFVYKGFNKAEPNTRYCEGFARAFPWPEPWRAIRVRGYEPRGECLFLEVLQSEGPIGMIILPVVIGLASGQCGTFLS